MTKRIVSGIFILTALGALGVILAGALTSGEQLIVRFLTAVIVAALGLYVISDLRLQADDDALTARTGGAPRVGAVEAPPNSTAAFMATVTRKIDEPLAATATTSALAVPNDPSLIADDEDFGHLVASADSESAYVEVAADRLPAVSENDDMLAANGVLDSDQLEAVSAAGIDDEVHDRYGHVEDEQVEVPGDQIEVIASAPPVEIAEVPDHGQDHTLAGVGALSTSTSELATSSSSSNGAASNHSNGSGYEQRNGHRAPDTVRANFLHSASVDISDLFSDHVSPPLPDAGSSADEYHSWPGEQANTANGYENNGFITPDDVDAVTPAEPVEPTTDEEDLTGPTDAAPEADTPADTAASEFEYSDDLASTEHVWPAAPAASAPGLHPFEKASAAYEAAKRKIEAVDEPAAPTSLPVASTAELDAVSYADAPLAPIIDLREVAGTDPDEVDNAIHVGEVEVIATLIEQGMLNTEGPISDREVRTMVYVAFTSNELRKLLIAGGSPDGPNYDLDLGPVELFDERRHTPAPKTLYSGIDHPQPKTKLG